MMPGMQMPQDTGQIFFSMVGFGKPEIFSPRVIHGISHLKAKRLKLVYNEHSEPYTECAMPE